MLLEDHVVSLVREFAESQGVNREGVINSYESLLDIGPTVIDALASIVSDEKSPYRIVAIDLLECFHSVLDSTLALPSLRSAMKEGDPWLRLCAAEAVWIIDGKSPKDIDPEALTVISESAHSELARVRGRARNTLQTLKEMRFLSG